MNCNQVRNFFKVYLSTGEADKDKLKDAWSHAAQCRQCLDTVKEMLDALDEFYPIKESIQLKTAAGGECTQEVPLEMAELPEEKLKAAHPDFWEHIQSCPACRAEYEDIRSFVIREEQGEFGEAPNMTLIKQEKQKSRTWETLKSGILKLKNDIQIITTRKFQDINQKTPFVVYLQLQPAAGVIRTTGAIRTRGAVRTRGYAKSNQTSFSDPANDITISAIFDQTNQGIKLTVKTTRLESERPIKEAQVHLKENETIKYPNQPGQGGLYEFTGLTEKNYTIQIKHKNQTYRLPVNIQNA